MCKAPTTVEVPSSEVQSDLPCAYPAQQGMELRTDPSQTSPRRSLSPLPQRGHRAGSPGGRRNVGKYRCGAHSSFKAQIIYPSIHPPLHSLIPHTSGLWATASLWAQEVAGGSGTHTSTGMLTAQTGGARASQPGACSRRQPRAVGDVYAGVPVSLWGAPLTFSEPTNM